MSHRTFDPVTLEILWNRLIAATDEMATTLLRTAFSSVVREARDMACALFDARGRMVAQSWNCTAGLLGSTLISVQNVCREFPPEQLRPGDALITNDPWIATGHMLDITVVTPIFRDEELVGFACAVGHVQDIGGRFSTMESTEIYEEGLRIPVCKLEDGGCENELVFKFIRNNVRSADVVIGDIRALAAANRAGAARLLEIMADSGLDSIEELAEEIISRTERDMRAGIAAIPDGTYRHELTLDTYREPLTIAVAITVTGSDMLVDFAGTSPQVPFAINSAINFTRSYSVVPIKGTISATTPNNEGTLRPLRIEAPPGSLLHAIHPASVVARHNVGAFAVEAVLGALAKAAPEKVMAASSQPIWVLRFGGRDSVRGPFHVVQMVNGGFGARADKDGVACLSYPGNVSGVPVEMLESDSPLLFEKREAWIDSGGAGRYRGGCGVDMVTTVLPRYPAADGRPRQDTDQVTMGPVICSIRADRFLSPASGMQGGGPGSAGQVVLNGEVINARGTIPLQPGDSVLWRIPGGGGFWDPLERDPDAVLTDVREGYVSPAGAMRDYGVVLGGDPLAVDRAATEEERRRRRRGVDPTSAPASAAAGVGGGTSDEPSES